MNWAIYLSSIFIVKLKFVTLKTLKFLRIREELLKHFVLSTFKELLYDEIIRYIFRKYFFRNEKVLPYDFWKSLCFFLWNASKCSWHCVKSVQIRSIFWSVFSRIQSKCGKIWIRKYSVFGDFLHSVIITHCARFAKVRDFADP